MDCIDYASIWTCKNGERMVYVKDNTALNECEKPTTTFDELTNLLKDRKLLQTLNNSLERHKNDALPRYHTS